MNPILEFFADRQDLMFLSLVVLEITVIACLTLIGIRLTRRDAATRYALGLCGLILIASAAPATWFIQNSSWTSVGWERMIMIDPTFVPIEMGHPVSEPTPLWMWIWGVGAGLVLARIGLGFIRVHMLRRDSIQLEKLSSDVAVYATDDAGPAVVGTLKPAVLMPRKLLDTLSDEEIHDVLAHEFAHVAHRHLIVALFQRILAAVYWPHPLIHLLNRELINAREEICDNAVLRSAGAARYARVLLRVAECRLQPRHFSASLGLFGPSTSLETRVKSLLDPNRRIESNMNKRKVVAACTALTLGMATVAGARVQTQVVVAPQEKSLPAPAIKIEQVPSKKAVKLKKAKAQKAKVLKAVRAKASKPGVMAKPTLIQLTAPGSIASPTTAAPAVAPTTIVAAPALPSAPAVATAPIAVAPSTTIAVPVAPQKLQGTLAPSTGRVFYGTANGSKDVVGTTSFFQAEPKNSTNSSYRVIYQSGTPAKTASPTTVYGTQVKGQLSSGKSIATTYRSLSPGAVYNLAGSKATAQKGSEAPVYRSMRGEDRPDVLAHPLGVESPQKAVRGKIDRLNYRIETLAPAKGLRVMPGQVRVTAPRDVAARTLSTKLSNLQIDRSRYIAATKNFQVALPSDQKVVVKESLDKGVEYRLRFNKESGKWEVIPPTKSDK